MKRQPRVILWLVAALCLLAACGVPADEEPSVPPTAAPEAVFSGLRELPGDGLTHDPYGWDNLYGSKEVPVVWWQREPRDGMAGQRGRTVENYCVNWYKDQQGETYTPVPYYFVPDRYGLFVDST